MDQTNSELPISRDQEQEGIPSTLFTGTNLEYVQKMIDKYGSYRQEQDDQVTYLADKILVAFNAAINRGYMYKGTPIILIVNAQAQTIKVERNKKIGFTNDFITTEIPLNAILGAYKVNIHDRTQFILSDDDIAELQKCPSVNILQNLQPPSENNLLE